ncbi:pyroglutamyl-peptidase [Lentibacillus halodurans]|uniref:Pyroglutamyl-peptidase I n=1 Tax=Lentibacillus halodurans TaxID=237679 RepID=A0A1I0WFL1_9BACI|nr:pyroglutamyl-peptidase I [Lentibacillus halodurans]SFA87555.1 pyroglutamyl-peptidase [Lentibacillus halodurans]
MKKLLLTGFEPFLAFSINPTAEIVRKLNQRKMNNFQVVGDILTVDFQKSGKQLVDIIEDHNPDAIISLGLAAGRNRITPERIAINCNDGPQDNGGYKPVGEKIFADGPDGLFTRLPIRQMVKHLQNAGLPAEISNTAGAYLCNHVMYHGLYYFDGPAGFIHLPASHALAVEKKLPSWSQQDLLQAVKVCIESL